RLEKTCHRAVLEALTSDPLGARWVVQQQPVIAGVCPDLLAESPSGQYFVVNVKATAASRSVNLAALAQLATFRDAIAGATGRPAGSALQGCASRSRPKTRRT